VNRRPFLALGLVVLAGVQAPTTPPGAATGFPPNLESYLTNAVWQSAAERKRLLEGAAVTKLLDADKNSEVAVFGAIWIEATMRQYVEAVQDIEHLESGSAFPVTRRISTPPRPEDFAAMHLPRDDVTALRSCRLGNCPVKLGEAALQRFRSDVDWKAPDVQAAADGVMQQLAFEYVKGYLEGGNERLAIYRDQSRPTFVAGEFRAMVDRMPELTAYMPNLRRYLLDYPKVELTASVSFLYWQETRFGLKLTIRISHLTVVEGQDDPVVASKMLYATHYFWTGLELRVLLPDPSRGPGFWFVTVNRSRSDGLSGFTGMFVRGRVRSEVQNGSLAALQATKKRLEQRR
jgi:hypothetical protein